MGKSKRSPKGQRQTDNRKSAGKKQAASKPLSGFGDGDTHEKLRNAGLATFVALIVITHLQPTESWAKQGGGAMTIMMWALLFAAWTLIGLLRPNRIRSGPDLISLGVLLGWIVIGGFVMGGAGNLRATANSVWTWLTMGIVYFLTRQFLIGSTEKRAFCGVMIALALILSCHGYYQYFYRLPQDRAQYHQDPDGELAKAGIVAPPGSVTRKLFESRLESDEPFSTFGLANSFAGMLAPWLLLTCGLLLTKSVSNSDQSSHTKPPADKSRGAMLTILLGIAGCLILTKSRSATLAVMCGVVAILIFNHWQTKRTWKLRYLAITSGVTLVLIGLGFAVGSLDREVFTQAGKSLGYRLEYWQATSAMILDYPLFGCGTGNFQDYYTQYQLPQSSETIAEPHNFLFEITSNAGIPALIAFLTFLVLVIRHVFANPKNATPSDSSEMRKASEQQHSTRAIYTGAVAGLIIAYPMGFVSGFIPPLLALGSQESAIRLPLLIFIGIPLGTLVITLLTPWIQHGTLNRRLLFIPVAATLINLLAAGGIAFPAVAISFWVLVGILFNSGESSSESLPRETLPDEMGKSRAPSICLAVAGLGLAVACNFTAYSPVIRAIATHADATSARSNEEYGQAITKYRSATQIDPWWPSAKRDYADLLLEQWRLTNNAEALALFQAQATQYQKSHPQSASTEHIIGRWYLTIYREQIAGKDESDVEGAQQWLDLAEKAYQRSSQLQPNQAMRHAQLAWIHWLQNNREMAKSSAQTAHELDQQTPHEEQKLRNQQVFDLDSPKTTPTSNPTNAEQLMDAIRSS